MPAHRPTVRRAVRCDAWPVAVVVATSLVAGVAWRWRTRPMGDSWSYRTAGRAIVGGWHQLTDRTPGYPLLLWVTGSLQHETHVLFVVQLLLHAASVLLVVDVARRWGVPVGGRIAIALLLSAPPEMILVVSSGSEALTQALVAVCLWCFARWCLHPGSSALIGVGLALGAVAWVRPSFALLAVPLVVVVAAFARRGSRPRSLARLGIPVVVLIGALLAVHVVRFDRWTLTPLTGWYLGSRTSTYVDRLPASDEPARSILVAERNRQLLRSDEVDAPNYSFAVRGTLRRALGMSERQLDDYLLHLNLRLIAHHPFEYLDAATTASARYVQIDAEPPLRGLGRWAAWAMSLVHLAVVAASVAAAAGLAGRVLHREVDRPTLALWCGCVAIVGYTWLTAVLVETGTPRLRVPTDPLIVLLVVMGLSSVAGAWRTRGPRPSAGPM
jgi:hypothetical protein